MKKQSFLHPMNKTEAVVGWIYVFVHSFAMVYILAAMNTYLFPMFGFQLNEIVFNFVWYFVGFIFLLIFLFHFLRESFADLWGNLLNTLVAVMLGYVANVLLSSVVSLVLSGFLSDLTNPNQAAVEAVTKLNPNSMVATAVLLAPVVEETLFRGVVFGTIRRKSAFLAYVVSCLLFSFYHLWQELIFSFSPELLLYMLQYIPAGIVLAWCYSYSRNIWGPVFLHMMINFISIKVTIG